MALTAALSRKSRQPGPEIARVNAIAQLSHLLPLLAAWRRDLVTDIQRAEQRGFTSFAGDLRRLTARVDRVLTAARGLARHRTGR